MQIALPATQGNAPGSVGEDLRQHDPIPPRFVVPEAEDLDYFLRRPRRPAQGIFKSLMPQDAAQLTGCHCQ
ncbi:hypothetical protein HLB44_29725 [Aquincola sp. S2]|uniref:Uncharacterized protein n=1 Tax=Pseudaquabacterium terrae TaxID=2732868 RepID=A0ABX2ER59_9BURK|nr:hypothetical protein [Aquabacterium terrae]NRF71180.1 hypothetical protein [Aquabacterium terrae]